jgi:hypothetical protein
VDASEKIPGKPPSGGGQRADPVQKHDPGERDVSRVKKGIDKPRPVTEADVSSNGLIAFVSTRPNKLGENRPVSVARSERAFQ